MSEHNNENDLGIMNTMVINNKLQNSSFYHDPYQMNNLDKFKKTYLLGRNNRQKSTFEMRRNKSICINNNKTLTDQFNDSTTAINKLPLVKDQSALLKKSQSFRYTYSDIEQTGQISKTNVTMQDMVFKKHNIRENRKFSMNYQNKISEDEQEPDRLNRSVINKNEDLSPFKQKANEKINQSHSIYLRGYSSNTKHLRIKSVYIPLKLDNNNLEKENIMHQAKQNTITTANSTISSSDVLFKEVRKIGKEYYLVKINIKNNELIIKCKNVEHTTHHKLIYPLNQGQKLLKDHENNYEELISRLIINNKGKLCYIPKHLSNSESQHQQQHHQCQQQQHEQHQQQQYQHQQQENQQHQHQHQYQQLPQHQQQQQQHQHQQQQQQQHYHKQWYPNELNISNPTINIQNTMSNVDSKLLNKQAKAYNELEKFPEIMSLSSLNITKLNFNNPSYFKETKQQTMNRTKNLIKSSSRLYTQKSDNRPYLIQHYDNLGYDFKSRIYQLMTNQVKNNNDNDDQISQIKRINSISSSSNQAISTDKTLSISSTVANEIEMVLEDKLLENFNIQYQ